MILCKLHNSIDTLYSKAEKGELIVRDKIENGDVIISNNVSLLDYLYLEIQYSPLFTAVAINKETGNYGFRKLSIIEILTHAIGIKFPKEVSSSQVYHSIKDLINS